MATYILHKDIYKYVICTYVSYCDKLQWQRPISIATRPQSCQPTKLLTSMILCLVMAPLARKESKYMSMKRNCRQYRSEIGCDSMVQWTSHWNRAPSDAQQFLLVFFFTVAVYRDLPAPPQAHFSAGPSHISYYRQVLLGECVCVYVYI